MNEMSQSNKTAEYLADICIDKYTFLIISGNGGSGKTTLAMNILNEITKKGLRANYIEMDQFLVDTKLRKSALKSWVDLKGNERESYYSSTFKESYYMNAVESIVHAYENGESGYYKNKHTNEYVSIDPNAVITIIEGVAAAFLDCKNSLRVFVTCDFETEVNRRISRARNGESMKDIEILTKECRERRDQFEAIIAPIGETFDIKIVSDGERYTLSKSA